MRSKWEALKFSTHSTSPSHWMLVGKSCWWSSHVASSGHVRLQIIESDHHEKSYGNKFLSSHSTSVRDRMCVILDDKTGAKKDKKTMRTVMMMIVLAMRLCRTNIKIVMSTLLGSVKERRKERQLTSITNSSHKFLPWHFSDIWSLTKKDSPSRAWLSARLGAVVAAHFHSQVLRYSVSSARILLRVFECMLDKGDRVCMWNELEPRVKHMC